MWGERSGGKEAHSLVYDIVGIHTIRHCLGNLWYPSLCACQHHLSKGWDEESRSQRVRECPASWDLGGDERGSGQPREGEASP